MAGSFQSFPMRSCEWATDIPRLPTASFAPRQNVTNGADAFGSRRDQFCMDTVNAFVASYVQPTPANDYVNSRGSYECSAEDLGLLNIPSIHETLGSSLDLHDADLARRDSSSERECDDIGDDGTEDVSTSIGDTAESTCDRLEDIDRASDASGDAPRPPVKRLRRQRANDRERRRMKSLNGALNNLKRCIPLPKAKRRVTKLEILRIACHYIQTLWETLNNGNEAQTECVPPRNAKRKRVVNGMTVTQRLSLLSNNLKLNFQF